MENRQQHSARLAIVAALTGLLGLAVLPPAARAAGTAEPSAIEARSLALSRATNAVLALHAVAVDGARSAPSLGQLRQGSGVLIADDGLVLTIGYLVLEAQKVELVTDSGTRVPARVVAYDQATGFGLVQALAPLKALGLMPVPLGDPAALDPREPLTLASGGEDAMVSVAQLVSRRDFSGYWEYHVAGALFTAPARRDHSGAGLFNGRGELLGIGSLFVNNAHEGGAPPQPGNMFVPVDLLRPILDELRRDGSSRASRRAWLGLNCVEDQGQVLVMRVTDDSPADVAGLEAGDRILRIDDTRVSSLAVLWKTLWAGSAPEREVRLEILRDGRPQTLKLHAVDRAKTWRRPAGI